MKKIVTYSAFLFAVLIVSVLTVNAQNTASASKQEEAQQVAQPEAFFKIESLDNAKNLMEEAYVKYQNASAEQSETLGAEFRQLRREYMAALERESANYSNSTETGSKIQSEMLKTYKDLR